MKSITLTISLLLCSFSLLAQISLSGTVKDTNGQTIPFANIYLEEETKGGASDENGLFKFSTTFTGKGTLVVSAIGYNIYKESVMINDQNLLFHIQLQQHSTALQEVVVTADPVESLEQVTSMKLQALEIVTNASANGDIYQALQTLPGVSKVGDQTGLFVRGGESSEAQTIIDGTLASNPFYGDTPNMSSRGRFDPFMFQGTTFSTGGYSAEYGHALSSVLILETQGIPERTATNFNVHLAGLGVAHTKVWKEQTAVIAGLSYNNLLPFTSILPQNVTWTRAPEGVNANFAFRHQTKSGLLKSYVQYEKGGIGMKVFNPYTPTKLSDFTRDGQNLYINNSYRGVLAGKWGLFAGLSFNNNTSDIGYDQWSIKEHQNTTIGKVTLSNMLSERISLLLGAELRYDDHLRDTISVQDAYSSSFAEMQFDFNEYLTLRTGVRAEYSALMDRVNLAPRTNLIWKIDPDRHFSLSYGQFYQKAKDEHLALSNELAFQKASHYIMNYESRYEGTTFRAEVYYKAYDQLTKFSEKGVNNNGYGFARGIDLFWRDKRNISNLDYWVTYSYVDSKRDYLHFPTLATPTFVTNHIANVVANYKLSALRLEPSLTYTFASGRTYENPHDEVFLSSKTKDYHNLDVALSYQTLVKGNYTVFFASLSNVFATKQVFGYQYSMDSRTRVAKVPSSDQTIFFGMFMTIQ